MLENGLTSRKVSLKAAFAKGLVYAGSAMQSMLVA